MELCSSCSCEAKGENISRMVGDRDDDLRPVVDLVRQKPGFDISSGFLPIGAFLIRKS